MVAFTFQDYKGKQSDYEVNHIDKNPSNNYETNLEILIHKDHATKDQGIPILGLSDDNKYVIFPSHSKAGEIIERHHSGIKKAMDRKGKCGPYKWFPLDSDEAQKILSSDEYEEKQHVKK